VSGSAGNELAPWGSVLLGALLLALSLVAGSRAYLEAVEKSRRTSRLFPLRGSRDTHRQVNRLIMYAGLTVGAALIVWGLVGLI
jgi:hypothetical protein